MTQHLITVEEAHEIILSCVPPSMSERLALMATLGRTLAEPIISRDTIPPFNNSAMDGFAVRVEDVTQTPVHLTMIEDIPAGVMPQKTLTKGTCARIMTGAPIPEKATAVVPVEWTALVSETTIQINQTPNLQQHIRWAGDDVKAGAEILPSGTIVTPSVIGMMATLGYAEVAVARRPNVAVIATGDELVDVAADLHPGQIRNANGPALCAQVEAAGGLPIGPFLARDNRTHLRTVLQTALDQAEVLVISGGVSMGEYDLVKTVLDELGLILHFWKVRQRPGKPLAFGQIGTVPVFGLPGNPVSSAVCFEQYVRPALAKMLGRKTWFRPRISAKLGADFPKKAGLHHFHRGRFEQDEKGHWLAYPTGAQGSHIYSSMVAADGLVHLPETDETAPAGHIVEIEWL